MEESSNLGVGPRHSHRSLHPIGPVNPQTIHVCGYELPVMKLYLAGISVLVSQRPDNRIQQHSYLVSWAQAWHFYADELTFDRYKYVSRDIYCVNKNQYYCVLSWKLKLHRSLGNMWLYTVSTVSLHWFLFCGICFRHYTYLNKAEKNNILYDFIPDKYRCISSGAYT